MNAKQMFESLGYKYSKDHDDNEIIEYYKFEGTTISFWIREREFIASECCEYPINITVDEFKAIQQQLKELGWLEEETCTNKSEYDSIEQFECSNCGFISVDHTELKINEDNGEELYQVYKPKYCPNCGRKIVD